MLHTVHCTVYTAYCTVYTAHYTVHTAYCTVHTAHCIVYSVHYTLHSAYCTLYTTQCTVYTAHCTVYTAHYTLYTTHPTEKCYCPPAPASPLPPESRKYRSGAPQHTYYVLLINLIRRKRVLIYGTRGTLQYVVGTMGLLQCPHGITIMPTSDACICIS